jgi:hypothetical protein
MRNTNKSIDLWPIQFSDYAADTRKLNAYNALRQTPIVTTRAGGVRTRHSQENTSRGVGRDVVDGRARLRPSRHWHSARTEARPPGMSQGDPREE